MFHLLFTTAGSTSSGGSSSDPGAVIAAVIAAAAAFLSAGFAYAGNRKQQTLDSGAAQRQDALQRDLAAKSDELQRSLLAQQQEATNEATRRERVLVQMNELYGPLFMLRSESRQLRKYVGPESHEWRLVDHIAETKRDPVKSSIVENILEINARLVDLLIGKAGLVELSPPPASFQEFLAHARLLQTAWERGEDQGDERFPFPLQFDQDVEAALNRLHAEL